MEEIPLTKDQVALVDDEDFEWLSKSKWCACKSSSKFYAVRATHSESANSGWVLQLMHNAIWEYHFGLIPGGYTTDHIDLTGLNNQKDNLRLATPAQQAWNRGLYETNTSGYIGVYYVKDRGKYRAYITPGRKRIWLGHFDDPAEAARARDSAAIEHFGEFAVLNFPPE